MDFVALMLFTQQVLNLQCLLFRIKSQPGVAYESAACEKRMLHCFVVFLP